MEELFTPGAVQRDSQAVYSLWLLMHNPLQEARMKDEAFAYTTTALLDATILKYSQYRYVLK